MEKFTKNNIFLSLSSLNVTNNIPSFSLGEYYDYKNKLYTASESNSNEFDHCDCLRTNPLLETSDDCKMSLNQDSYNKDKKSKRSVLFESNIDNRNDWSQSSSLDTLKSFNLGSNLVRKKN